MIDGFFHGDPHPGNLGVTQDKKLFFLDFGVAGHLNEEQRQLLNKLVLGLLSRDLEKALSAIISVGIVTATTDRNQLKWELERLQEKYYKLPLREIQLGQVLHELMEISFKQHIKLPRDLTLLAKTIFTLEGLISMLEPDYSIAEMAKPLSEELAKTV